MSKTSSKSYTVEARKGNVLNLTKNGNIRLNATRRNPRADEEKQPATLPMGQMFEYIYILTGQESDDIRGVTFKPLDGIEITAYISDVEVRDES
tara:strand:+ start:258 stop:539 length:282 start_codon:yes stop_codon:yes gene_type:complete